MRNHERAEVQATMELPAPRQDLSTLLQATSDMVSGDIDFKALTRLPDNAFPSPNARHRRHLAVESNLLIELRRSGSWDAVHDVWHSMLALEHAVRLQRMPGAKKLPPADGSRWKLLNMASSRGQCADVVRVLCAWIGVVH